MIKSHTERHQESSATLVEISFSIWRAETVKDNMALSIVSIFFCCILGIIATLKSHEVSYIQKTMLFSITLYPGRVKPRTLILVLAADPPSAWHNGFSAKSGRPGVRIM
ncbi:hypothetical protein ElyMa_004142100 [Elysia marginata]|uniref:Uncharacterized protein n=1 Tax=Elysia marginata TaxID=1093978 RepID=A0AAV4GGA4_9GAST|nr:hypothetical protein ElyMa_004142100 [Elysia marginata]